MAQVPAGTRFVGIATDVDLKERGSAYMNKQQEPYTVEEIGAAARAHVLATPAGTDLDGATEIPSDTVVIALGGTPLTADGVRASGRLTMIINRSNGDLKIYPPSADLNFFGYQAGAPAVINNGDSFINVFVVEGI